MGRAAFSIKTKILMLREANRVEHRVMSKIAGGDHRESSIVDKSTRRDVESSRNGGINDSTCWVPHPKSGIYFPEGHEWVMKDVPEGAASLGRTFWLRNVDGVEKPEPDHHDLTIISM